MTFLPLGVHHPGVYASPVRAIVVVGWGYSWTKVLGAFLDPRKPRPGLTALKNVLLPAVLDRGTGGAVAQGPRHPAPPRRRIPCDALP